MAKPLRQSVIISGEKPARPSYGESISQSTIIVLGDYANTGKIKVSEVLSGDPSWTNKTLTLRSPLVMGCRLQPVPSFKKGAFIYCPPQLKGGRWGLTNEEYWEAFDLPDQISLVKFLVPIYKKQTEQQRLQALSELFIGQNIPKVGEFDGDPHSTFKKEFLWAITKMRKPENFEIVQKLYGRKDLSATDKLSLQDWIGNTLDPRANSLLIEALNSKDRFIVSDAVTKLTSYYRNAKTDAALILFLKTAPDELRPSIANYLKSRDVKSTKLSKAPAPQSLYQQAEELRQQGKLNEAVAIYIAILQSKETNSYVIRDAALKALRWGDAGTKTNILRSRLAWLAKDAASGNYLEVTDTAEILRRLNSPTCIDALFQVLHRRDSLFQNAHRTATLALREFGPEARKRAAASILDDIKNNTDLSNNLDQQIDTLLSFAWVKSKNSFQESQKLVEADKNWTSSWNKVIPLMESLSHEDEGLELSKLLRDGKDLSPKVIEWIVFRLGDLRDSHDVETLLHLYSDKPYYYQPTLKEALVKIGGAKIITYMRQSAIKKHPQQATAVEILAEIEKKKVLPVMHEVTRSGNLDARIRSIAAIGQYGNCDDRKALLPGADYWKGDRDVHYWLIQALNAIELRCQCQ